MLRREVDIFRNFKCGVDSGFLMVTVCGMDGFEAELLLRVGLGSPRVLSQVLCGLGCDSGG